MGRAPWAVHLEAPTHDGVLPFAPLKGQLVIVGDMAAEENLFEHAVLGANFEGLRNDATAPTGLGCAHAIG